MACAAMMPCIWPQPWRFARFIRRSSCRPQPSCQQTLNSSWQLKPQDWPSRIRTGINDEGVVLSRRIAPMTSAHQDPQEGEAARLARIATRIRVAHGDQPADLVLAGGQVVNVFSGEIYPADVAVVAGEIAGVAPPGTYQGRERHDLG